MIVVLGCRHLYKKFQYYHSTWVARGALENLGSFSRKHGFTFVGKVSYLKYKLSVIFRGKISRAYPISSNNRQVAYFSQILAKRISAY